MEASTHSHFGPVLTILQEKTGVEIKIKADDVECTGSEDFLVSCIYNIQFGE